jgi:hypothetical protein
MSKMRNEITGLAWLVKSRHQIQKILLKLIETGGRHEERLTNRDNAEELGTFAALVGASFGLWRSAFLLTDSAEKPHLLTDSLKFVEYLLRNNAVGYMQDVSTLDWSAVYYLNNTILRLNWIRLRRIPRVRSARGLCL